MKRFEVCLINLDPSVGHEIKRMRPCLIVSPDEMNKHIKTVIIAPMTTKSRKYPTRINCRFKGKSGQIVLDQIRTVDKIQLTKKLGIINLDTQKKVASVLSEMFQY